MQKKAVILIEPQDANILIPSRFGINTLIRWNKQVFKNAIKKILRKEIYYSHGNYEEVGNYVYTISEREIEKVALGLNLEYVAFKGLNDYYEEGVEFEEISDNSKLLKKVKKMIADADKQSRKGITLYGLLVSIIFKNHPGERCISRLSDWNYIVRKLPINPYL